MPDPCNWYPCCCTCTCVPTSINQKTFANAETTWNLSAYQAEAYYPEGCNGTWKIRVLPECNIVATGTVSAGGTLLELPASYTGAELEGGLSRDPSTTYPFCAELIVCCADADPECPGCIPGIIAYDTHLIYPSSGVFNLSSYATTSSGNTRWKLYEGYDCDLLYSGAITAGTLVSLPSSINQDDLPCPAFLILIEYTDSTCYVNEPACTPIEGCDASFTIVFRIKWGDETSTGDYDLYVRGDGFMPSDCACVCYYDNPSVSLPCPPCGESPIGSMTHSGDDGGCDFAGGPGITLYDEHVTASVNLSNRQPSVTFRPWFWLRDDCDLGTVFDVYQEIVITNTGANPIYIDVFDDVINPGDSNTYSGTGSFGVGGTDVYEMGNACGFPNGVTGGYLYTITPYC